jgi:ribosomal protein L9
LLLLQDLQATLHQAQEMVERLKQENAHMQEDKERMARTIEALTRECKDPKQVCALFGAIGSKNLVCILQVAACNQMVWLAG